MQKNRFRPLLKIIAILVIQAFIVFDVAWAAGPEGFSALRVKQAADADASAAGLKGDLTGVPQPKQFAPQAYAGQPLVVSQAVVSQDNGNSATGNAIGKKLIIPAILLVLAVALFIIPAHFGGPNIDFGALHINFGLQHFQGDTLSTWFQNWKSSGATNNLLTIPHGADLLEAAKQIIESVKDRYPDLVSHNPAGPQIPDSPQALVKIIKAFNEGYSLTSSDGSTFVPISQIDKIHAIVGYGLTAAQIALMKGLGIMAGIWGSASAIWTILTAKRHKALNEQAQAQKEELHVTESALRDAHAQLVEVQSQTQGLAGQHQELEAGRAQLAEEKRQLAAQRETAKQERKALDKAREGLTLAQADQHAAEGALVPQRDEAARQASDEEQRQADLDQAVDEYHAAQQAKTVEELEAEAARTADELTAAQREPEAVAQLRASLGELQGQVTAATDAHAKTEEGLKGQITDAEKALETLQAAEPEPIRTARALLGDLQRQITEANDTYAATQRELEGQIRTVQEQLTAAQAEPEKVTKLKATLEGLRGQVTAAEQAHAETEEGLKGQITDAEKALQAEEPENIKQARARLEELKGQVTTATDAHDRKLVELEAEEPVVLPPAAPVVFPSVTPPAKPISAPSTVEAVTLQKRFVSAITQKKPDVALKIVFVCTGGRFRSPSMADSCNSELRTYGVDADVSSFGVADNGTITEIPEEVSSADIIVCASIEQKRKLMGRFVPGQHYKIFTISDFFKCLTEGQKAEAINEAKDALKAATVDKVGYNMDIGLRYIDNIFSILETRDRMRDPVNGYVTEDEMDAVLRQIIKHGFVPLLIATQAQATGNSATGNAIGKKLIIPVILIAAAVSIFFVSPAVIGISSLPLLPFMVLKIGLVTVLGVYGAIDGYVAVSQLTRENKATVVTSRMVSSVQIRTVKIQIDRIKQERGIELRGAVVIGPDNSFRRTIIDSMQSYGVFDMVLKAATQAEANVLIPQKTIELQRTHPAADIKFIKVFIANRVSLKIEVDGLEPKLFSTAQGINYAISTYLESI